MPESTIDNLALVHRLRKAQKAKRKPQRLWKWGRTQGFHLVKDVLAAAEVEGPHASPKGLRHSFGVRAIQKTRNPRLVQKWLGHRSLETTTVYMDVLGQEETGPIGITVKFRESGGRFATYQLEIAEEAGRPVVDRENLKFRRGSHGQPWHFVDFSRGRGTAITNEAAYGQEGVGAERKEHVLDAGPIQVIAFK